MKRAEFSDCSLPLFQGAGAQPVPTAAPSVPSYLRDHRKRLRERFEQGGAAAMPDYELLELLLFGALPRQDVKPLARRLLERFGDLSSVISAPPAQLCEIEGVGPGIIHHFKLLEACTHRMARARVLNRPVLSSWSVLLDYCHTRLSHLQTEEVRVLYLDRKNVLIADEAQGQGTVDHVPVYPREILRRGLELNACALILVHNHPSGDPTPSSADIALTEQIRQGAEALGLVLHDHLVIGKSREVSFRSEGFL